MESLFCHPAFAWDLCIGKILSAYLWALGMARLTRRLMLSD
ncbi:hypothetical protein [Campylobacter upsaliensis]|nr:hypothetical protein [Campylobacter upsaliensis]